MKLLPDIFSIISLSIFFILSSTIFAQELSEKMDDKTLSPFFFVKSDDPNTDQLPLKATYSEINIAGVIADVHVTQIYENEGENPLEAIYIFPASTRAAVYNMKMTIGERIITAKIAKKSEAREQYEQAKADGKSASLLEQQRPNVFQMNVANIMPGDKIKVDLYYTELLVPTNNQYEFIYPTVVGPRYSNKAESEATSSEKWAKNPYLHEGGDPTYDFDLNLNLSAGMPVQEITCTSHKVNIDYQSEADARISLAPSEKRGGNRDFILKYRLAGNKIETGLLLYEGENENFFLTIMQPPDRVKEKQIPPREYIFIVDVSGSMHGFPLDVSKKLLRDLLLHLKSGDKFNLLLFAAGSSVMAEKSVPANEDNITRAIQIIDSEQGSGGTELLPALKKALALPKAEGYSRSIIIVTDGYVHVEKEAFDIIRHNMGNSNVFTFGIGSSVNRYLIEGMARVGIGESFVVTNSTEAVPKAATFREYILAPVLTDIKVKFNGFNTYDVEPISYPDVLAKRPIIIFGKWRGAANGEITLSGYTGRNKKYKSKLQVSQMKPSRDNNGLKYLWARFKIALLSDYRKISDSDELVNEVTELGLKYNLLTDFTSFVAIDTEIRNVDGKLTTIKQPLPLPQGVSDYAVAGGGSVSTMYRKSSGLRSAPLGVLNVVGHKAEAEEVSEDKSELELSLGSIIVDKKSERKSVSRVINKHMKRIKECINKWLQYFKNQNSTGKIEVSIIVNSSGLVDVVSVIKNELGNEDLEKCIIKEIKNWQFGSFKDTKTITITCQFILGS